MENRDSYTPAEVMFFLVRLDSGRAYYNNIAEGSGNRVDVAKRGIEHLTEIPENVRTADINGMIIDLKRYLT